MLDFGKEQSLNLRKGTVDYLTFGKGPRPLIMIQGLNTKSIKGAAASMAILYRVFAKDHTVYLFDRRKDLPEQITVRELAADIAEAMDRLNLSDADVLGVSQGGMIAQYLAIDRPDLVHKLVLAVTLSRNNPMVESVVGRWMELTKQGAMKELVTDMAERMYSDGYLRRYRPFLPLLTLLQKPTDVPRFLTLAQACLTCNAYEELDRVRCPVLVIGGRQDKIVGGEASVELAEKLQCRLHLYENLGHGAYEEAKNFNGLVAEFFRNPA